MLAIRFLPLLILANPAFAQSKVEPDAPTPDRVLYQKETQIDFDALALEASILRPGLLLSGERTVARFNPLIRIREDFAAEMVQSADTVR